MSSRSVAKQRKSKARKRTAKRKRSPWTKALAALAAVALTLAAVELVLRLVGFEYQLRIHVVESTAPNPDTVLDHFDIDPDLIWVRGDYDRIVEEAVRDRPALVFLGDSCTHLGRYPEYLAGGLERGLGRPVRHANLATAGWTAVQGLEQMRRDVVRIRPRLATVYYGWNDHWLSIGVEDRKALEIARMPVFRRQGSRLVQLLLKAYVGWIGEDDPPPVRVPLDSFRSSLRDLVAAAHVADVIPVLLTAPSSHAEGSEPKYLEGRWVTDLAELVPMHRRYADVVREVAATEGVPLCDLAAAFEGVPLEERRQRLFLEDGIHFQDLGDRYVAAALYRCFEDHGLLAYLG